jgi:phosphatidylserine decarboxylase
MGADFEPDVEIDKFTKNIKKWYDENHKCFKAQFDAMIKGLVAPPEDTKDEVWYDWIKHNTIDDLCTFLRKWFRWQPGVEQGLFYIEKFSWLSYENPAGLYFLANGQGRQMAEEFTRLQGVYMDSPSSKQLADNWQAELGPKKMCDYVIPKGGFKNFNEFFTRELKPEARPIDALEDDSVVTAPADCVINMIVDDLTDTTRLPVKTVTMNVKELLNNSKYADRFVAAGGQGGGTAVSCILMPDTYHWYHAPVTGRVVEAHDDVSGIYYGMGDFPKLLNKGNVGYGYDYSMFDDFRRGYLIIETAGYGLVGMVPVGLNSIGSVQFLDDFRNIGDHSKPVSVTKGDRIGFFKYGGSLNILLFEHGTFPALRLLQGQRIGHLDRTPSPYYAHHRRRKP